MCVCIFVCCLFVNTAICHDSQFGMLILQCKIQEGLLVPLKTHYRATLWLEGICSSLRRWKSAPSLSNPNPEPIHAELQRRLLFLLICARWGSAPFGWMAWLLNTLLPTCVTIPHLVIWSNHTSVISEILSGPVFQSNLRSLKLTLVDRPPIIGRQFGN